MRLSPGTSLRDRMMTVNILTVGLTLLAMGVVLVAGGLVGLRTMLRHRLEVQARIVGSNCTAALSFGDRAAAAETLESLSASADIVRAVIYTKEGAEFATYSRPDSRAPGPAGNTMFGGLRHLSASRPVALKEETIGRIDIESDLSGLLSTLWNFLLFVALLALCFILMSSVLFSRMQRKLTAPFTELVAVMEDVSRHGDYTLRVRGGGVDEATLLAGRFNEMLTQIERQDAEIKRHRDFLEQEVAWRTADLARELDAKSRAESALVSAAQQWRATFDAISDCVCMLDTAGRVVRCNTAFSTLVGRPFDAIIGTGINDLVYAASDSKERLEIGRLIGKRHRLLSTVSCFGKWFNVTVDQVAGNSSAPSGFVFIMTDTTERRSLEEHLAQSQKMDAIGTLAGGVAHDFNNILSVILSYSGFLLDELPADSGMRADVQEIKTSAERAAALTRQLLAFSRKQVVNPSALVVNDLINNLSKMLKRLIGEHISVEIWFDGDAGMVWMDPSQLEQILVNLVVNARDAMPKGGRIQIATKRVVVASDNPSTFEDVEAGDYIMVSVTDTGVGMDKNLQKRIFDPFFTTKPVGKGTGLGLSMVYGAVKQNKGMVKVYSEPGRGTTFHVYLRRHVEEGAAAAVGAESPAPRGKGELLLLVEDEEPVRRSVKKMLEGNGYRTVEAQNGEQGLSVFGERSGEIAMVISDVVMPGMGGIEMVGRLRELRPDLKALHMSGYTDEMLETHGVSTVRAFILTKPFEQRALLSKVREILDRS